jgi:TRAP-type C4-dicarboxylate transport system permease large subunit
MLMMLTVAYFAHKNGWGGDIKFEWPRVIKALAETAVVVIAWPLAVWLLIAKAGLPPQITVIGGAGGAVCGRPLLQLPGGAAHHDAGAADRRHDHRHLHAHRGRHCRLPVGHGAGLCLVPHAQLEDVRQGLLDTVETTATVLFIVAAASIFGWMLTATGVTSAIAQWVLGFTKEPWVFLLLANLLMLFVGCFLEPTAAITILVPILVPICQQAGH